MPERQKPTSPDEYPLAFSLDVQAIRQMNEFRQEVRHDVNELRQEIRQEIRSVHSRINWVFTSMVGVGCMVVASAGVVVAMLKP